VRREPVIGQKLIELIRGMGRQAKEDVLKVRKRIDVVVLAVNFVNAVSARLATPDDWLYLLDGLDIDKEIGVFTASEHRQASWMNAMADLASSLRARRQRARGVRARERPPSPASGGQRRA
jgi:hypothetical protein